MKKLLLSCATLLFSANVFADTPSFTYVELEYVASGEFEITDGRLSADADLDGYAATASLELGIFFFQASRFELDADLTAGNLISTSLEDSITTLAAGLTFELPRSQVYALVRARRDELSLEDDLASGDLGVVGAEAGIRINITDRFEINANAGVPSTDEGSSYGFGAQFFITDSIGITVDYTSLELEDDDVTADFDTTSLGIRYTF